MIGAVILAAGESSRMGEPKLLLEIKGELVIKRLINVFEGIVDKKVVVLGHEPENLIPIINKSNAEWVINEDYKEGMSSSFKTGVSALEGCDAAFLVLGDQPIIRKDYLKKAVNAWKKSAKMVSPIHNGKKGHPVLFDQSLFNEILALNKDETVRKVIHAHDDEHELIESGEWAITDFDTPEDYERVKKKF
ncbi:MAG: nucleotidyltransferase family protein [Hadesarchaea archaeon]|nr:nucleotidyltransferase family protein [Hadesarchaea archaeon]